MARQLLFNRGMTGGRQRCLEEEEWQSISPRYVPAPPDPDEEACATALERWQTARAFEERVAQVLREQDLSFTEWRILHAAAQAIRLTGDAVSQLAIAKQARLSKSTLSKHAWDMQSRGLLDAAPDFMGFAYRTLVTRKARTKLAAARAVIACIAAETWRSGDGAKSTPPR